MKSRLVQALIAAVLAISGATQAFAAPATPKITSVLPAPSGVKAGANGFSNSPSTLAVQWQAVAGANGVTVQSYLVIVQDASGTQVNPAPGTTVVGTSGSIPGTYTSGKTYSVGVETVDSTGASSAPSAPASVLVDTTAPTVTVTAPKANAMVNAVDATVDVSDTGGSGIEKVVYNLGRGACQPGACQFSMPPVTVTSAPWSATIPPAGFADTTWTIWAVVTDNAGNTTTSAANTFVFDLSPPETVTMTAPTANALFGPKTGTAVTLTTSVSDDLPLGTAQFETSANGGSTWSEVGGPLSLPTTSGCASCTSTATIATSNLADGSYLARVTASDIIGNKTTSTPVAFTVDTTPPPVPTITSPAGAGPTTATSYLIQGTAEANALVTLTGTTGSFAQQLSGGSTAFAITAPLSSGVANNFVVTATDAAGNVSAAVAVPTLTQIAAPASQPSTQPSNPGPGSGSSHGSGGSNPPAPPSNPTPVATVAPVVQPVTLAPPAVAGVQTAPPVTLPVVPQEPITPDVAPAPVTDIPVLPAFVSISVDPSADQFIILPGTSIGLFVPAGSYPDMLTVTLGPLTANSTAGNVLLGSSALNLAIVDSTGAPVSAFQQPLTLSFMPSVDDSAAAGGDASLVPVDVYDANNAQFAALATTVNADGSISSGLWTLGLLPAPAPVAPTNTTTQPTDIAPTNDTTTAPPTDDAATGDVPGTEDGSGTPAT